MEDVTTGYGSGSGDGSGDGWQTGRGIPAEAVESADNFPGEMPVAIKRDDWADSYRAGDASTDPAASQAKREILFGLSHHPWWCRSKGPQALTTGLCAGCNPKSGAIDSPPSSQCDLFTTINPPP